MQVSENKTAEYVGKRRSGKVWPLVAQYEGAHRGPAGETLVSAES